MLPGRLALLLSRAAKHGALAFAGPLLAALRDLHALAPLEQHDLQLLLQPLAACLQRPELAAAAAQLLPALATCGAPHAEVVQAALAAQAPLLQHLGMEAFRLYARACPPENVGRAVPPGACNPGAPCGTWGACLPPSKEGKELGCLPAMQHFAQLVLFRACHACCMMPLHAETGLPGETFTALMQQYAVRSPGPLPAAGEAAAWAAALRQEALGAAAALRRTVEAHRAAAEAAAAGAAAEPPARSRSEPPSQEGGSAGSSEQRGAAPGALVAAAERLDRALAHLEAALGSAQLDPAAASTLQRCAARLAQLLAAPAEA